MTLTASRLPILQLQEELKKATGQRTVPYVWVAGKLLGGCDDTKALIASGEFDKLIGGEGGGGVGGGSCQTPPTLLLIGGTEGGVGPQIDT